MRQDLFALVVLAAMAAAGCGGPAPGSPEAANAGTTSNGETGNDQTTANDGEKANGSADASAQPGMAINPQNTKIGFLGTKDDGSHTGGFNEFAGRIELDETAQQIKRISVEIQTESLWSDSPKLTGHLKQPDFFNVREYPTAKFESTRIEGDSGDLTVFGNLTLHGTTQEISFPAQASIENGTVTLTSEFQIDRTRFGMTYERGVHHEVTINVAVGTAREGAARNP